MITQERLVDQFMNLVRIDSSSLGERKMADTLTGILTGLGLEVTEDNAGSKYGSDTGNLISYLEGEGDPLLLCAHMDRVTPGKGIVPVLDGEVIRSSGDTILAADDLAGVSAILELLRHVKEDNVCCRPLEIVFTIAEEIGLFGSKGLDAGKLRSKAGIALDSTGQAGNIVTGAPAENKVEIKFIGKAAHAGAEPEKGISALQMAARAVDNMPLGRIDDETTANIGMIQGGEAVNIVTPETIIKGECRSHNTGKLKQQTEAMVAAAHQAAADFGGSIETEIEALYPAYRLGEGDYVVKLVSDAAEILGYPVNLEISGGGSDANILNGLGIKTVNIGVGAEKVHTLEEYIKIAELVKVTRLLEKIVVY